MKATSIKTASTKMSTVTSLEFQKYYNQIPEKQRNLDFSKLSNYKCYANAHGEK